MGSAGKIAGGVIFAAFWIVGFIVMQRFLTVENRPPTFSEANLVGVKTVLTVLGTLLAIGLCIALVVLIMSLIGSLLGETGAAEGGGGARGKPGGNADQNEQAVQTLMGVFGSLLVLYTAPFLNLALLSRFFQPRR